MKCNYHTGCSHEATVFIVTSFPTTFLGPVPDEINILCPEHHKLWCINVKHLNPEWDKQLTEDEAICWLVMES